MALSTSNNFLQSLIGAGADAQGNLYEIDIQGGKLTDINTPLKIRCDSFTPPDIPEPSTYAVKYLTAFIDRPTTKVAPTKNFDLTFRLDAYLDVYKTLLEQQRITFNPALSYAANDIQTLMYNDELFMVTVHVVKDAIYGEYTDTAPFYKYYGCWITGITPSAYDYNGSQPMTASVSINYLYAEDLQSGVTGSNYNMDSMSIGEI